MHPPSAPAAKRGGASAVEEARSLALTIVVLTSGSTRPGKETTAALLRTYLTTAERAQREDPNGSHAAVFASELFFLAEQFEAEGLLKRYIALFDHCPSKHLLRPYTMPILSTPTHLKKGPILLGRFKVESPIPPQATEVRLHTIRLRKRGGCTSAVNEYRRKARSDAAKAAMQRRIESEGYRTMIKDVYERIKRGN